MIEVVDFIPEHLDMIKIKSCHDGEKPETIAGTAITLLFSNEPIAIVGWHFVSPGVVQIWAFLSDGISLAKKSFHKEILSLLRWAFESHPIQRIQMSVRVGYSAGWRWAQSLGFTCEGVMKKYGPNGNDYWLFARTSI